MCGFWWGGLDDDDRHIEELSRHPFSPEQSDRLTAMANLATIEIWNISRLTSAYMQNVCWSVPIGKADGIRTIARPIKAKLDTIKIRPDSLLDQSGDDLAYSWSAIHRRVLTDERNWITIPSALQTIVSARKNKGVFAPVSPAPIECQHQLYFACFWSGPLASSSQLQF